MMVFGTAYYPETFDPSEWERDLSLMKETGFEVTRVLDFAWPWVEPREGEYDFSGLDRYLDLTAKLGMKVVLCTPTAAPPAWLATQYPQVMVEERSGRRRAWGTRRGQCLNSPIYRHFSTEIASVLGQRYGNHPAVIGWQIDNEIFGPEPTPVECHCPECVFRFRTWLKKRYASVKELNDTWGMMFWNQCFSDWGEVGTPRSDRSNDGQVVDYQEFFSDCCVEYLKLQYEVLRKTVGKSQWVSHNSTGTFNVGIDHREYCRSLDVGGWDAYPGSAGRPMRLVYAALAHDLYRSASHRPFNIYETTTFTMWPEFIAEMRARGANMIMWWHWRSMRWGSESGTDTLVDFNGAPRPGKLEAVKRTRERLSTAPDLPASIPPRKAAILFSYTNVRHEMRQRDWPESPYLRNLPKAYQPFRQLGIALDVVSPGEDISGYKLVVAPSLQLLADRDAKNLSDFVSEGGILWACAPMACKDNHAKWLPQPGSPVREMLGVKLLHIHSGGETTANVEDLGDFEVEERSQPVEAESAKVLARFSNGKYKGMPALTVNSFGKGKAFYMACASHKLGAVLARKAIEASGLPYVDNTCEDVAVMPHLVRKGTWYFNQSDQDQTVNGVTIQPHDFEFVP